MAVYTCYMGDSITATITEITVNNISLYTISISGSGPMYDKITDFQYPQGQTFNSWSRAVLRCYQDTLIIPEGITTLADLCFNGLGEYYSNAAGNERPGVYHVSCPESLRIIGDQAFQAQYYSNILKIQSISFGHNVEKIGRYAFEHQHDLTRLEFYGNPTIVNGGAFSDCHNLEYINIANDWEGLDYSGPSYETFNNCWKLEHINALNKIHTFQGNMYYKCNKLGRVTIDATDFSLQEVKRTSFYVELFAGDNCDEDGNYITEVNVDSYLTQDMLSYDWKENWHRVIAYVTFASVHLYHMGRHIEIMCYERGALPLKHEDMWFFLKWIRLVDESGSNPEQTPLHVAHNGHWYQICY